MTAEAVRPSGSAERYLRDRRERMVRNLIEARGVRDNNPGFGVANLSIAGDPWVGFILRDNIKTEAIDSDGNFDDDFASIPEVGSYTEDSSNSGVGAPQLIIIGASPELISKERKPA